MGVGLGADGDRLFNGKRGKDQAVLSRRDQMVRATGQGAPCSRISRDDAIVWKGMHQLCSK